MDFQSISNTIKSVPTDVWLLLPSALGLSAFQLKLHKWFSVQSAKVKQAITLALSLATAVIPAALGWLGTNPESLGAHTAIVFTAMTLFYRYVVKGAAENFADFKDYKTNKNLNKDTQVITPTVDAPAQDPNEFLGS